ncbi:MAG: hypothetical protein IKA30_04255, partial [Alphaproteobacteria bacterium]|nr:hypothetical protein [Alphaproteobacteria bacterium]
RTSVSSRATTTATSRTSTVSRGSTRSTSTPRVEPRHDNHHHNVHHGGHHHHAPHFSHGHRYHHHHCVFDAWRWITYLNYTNRFVCHSYYADRFFDTMLGYYVYGSMDNPNKIQVGNVTFYRYNDYLGVHNNQYKSYSLNQNQHLIYYIGYTTVDVVIQNGYARLYIYDDYGNEAVYYL